MRGRGVGGPGGFGARLRCGAERLDGQPGACDVGGRGGVADPPFGAEDAEDVEDVVAVVGEGEGVHQGVEVDGDEGQGDEDGEHEDSGEERATSEEEEVLQM